VAHHGEAGVMSGCRHAGPHGTGPQASVHCSTCLLLRRLAFLWCALTSTPIRERPCTRRCRRRQHDGGWTAGRSRTPPSTPVGSPGRQSTSAFYSVHASTADGTTPMGGAVQSVPGKSDATNHRSKSIGAFPAPSPGINSKNFIRSLTTARSPHEKEPVNRRLSDY
jgi:hypothetical protein